MKSRFVILDISTVYNKISTHHRENLYVSSWRPWPSIIKPHENIMKISTVIRSSHQTEFYKKGVLETRTHCETILSEHFMKLEILSWNTFTLVSNFDCVCSSSIKRIVFTEKRYVCWPSAAIVNFQIESNITFQKRDKNLFQNFKTPFILMQFSNETIKWTKTAKQFLFYFHSFNFGF